MKKLSRRFIPNLGTLIILGLFLFVQAVGAFPLKELKTQSTSLPALINYQGQLNDAGGDPVPDGTYTMTFRLYSQATGGTPLWTELRDVTVSDGLFNVMLGEVTSLPAPFPSDPVYLGVKVGTDGEMMPRERLGSAPFALVANVADGSLTTAKIADDAVTADKIAHQFGMSNKPLLNYVARENLSNWDWTSATGTGNGIFVDWDISPIVSSEAVAVVVRGMFRDDHSDSRMVVRRDGTNHNFHNPETLYLFSMLPDTWHKETAIIPLTGGQTLEIELFDANGTGIYAARLAILGWWEPAHTP